MSNVQETLISIYDAAIDPARWQDALDNTTTMVGSSSASLLMVTTRAGERVGSVPFSLSVLSGQLASLDPALIAYYVTHHAMLESDSWQRLKELPAGSLLTDNEFYPDMQAVRSRPDYVYLVNQLGLFRRMVARLNDNRSWYDAIGFQWRHDVMEIPSQSIKQARFLLPHLSQAFTLARRNHQLHQRYQAVIGALDQVQIGVCIADEDAGLVISNKEAHRILEMNDGIRIGANGRLIVSDLSTDARLMATIKQIALTAAGKAYQAGATLMIERPSGEHPFLLDVTPIRDCLGELENNVAGAMLTIIDPGNHQPFQTRRVAVAYGLSDAEVEVCRYVVEGRSNQSIADERNVSLDTVKTQVKSIMNKTGTRGRADLIRLVVRTAPPINLDDPPEGGWADN